MRGLVSLTNDASRLAPVVETLLARDLLPSRSVTAFLAYRGSIIASALWTARIGAASRPADVMRRLRFIAWMKLIGRPAHAALGAALAELHRRSADEGGANEIACTEDVLRSLPAMPDDDLRGAAALFVTSSAASVRRLATTRVR